jgi:4-hydroxybenzoate polyprenyltransferase
MQALRPYVELARVGQWLKNVSIVPGLIVAAFFRPRLGLSEAAAIATCVAAACLLSSSNYVLNGLLDSTSDRSHPLKNARPLAAGTVSRSAAWVEWAILAAAGLAAAFAINREVGTTAIAFLLAALVYNVPPVRAKDLPYLDVVVESVNNPLRLALGWFVLIRDRMPPLSLLFAYWALGAFFLVVKRLAELRFLARRQSVADSAAYRRSFAHYSEDLLLASAAFCLVFCAFFSGVFIVRFKLELVLMVPAAAWFLAYYLRLGLRDESPAQRPEEVFRLPRLAGYLVACLVVFFVLLRADIPALYRLFNVAPASAGALWPLDE